MPLRISWNSSPCLHRESAVGRLIFPLRSSCVPFLRHPYADIPSPRNIPATTKPILEGIDGGTAPMATAGGESDLDFQISYPIIYPQNSILFQTDDLPYATGEQSSSGFLNVRPP